MSVDALAALGVNIEEESQLRHGVEAAVEVDADPRTLAEAAKLRDATAALRKAEEEFDQICDEVSDAPDDMIPQARAALMARKRRLEDVVSLGTSNVDRLTREIQQARAARLRAVAERQRRDQQAEREQRVAEEKKEEDDVKAATGTGQSGNGARRLLFNGAVSAGSSHLVSARRAQRMLNPSHLDPAHTRSAPAAAAGRVTGAAARLRHQGGGASTGATTDTMLDYRGGAEVLESALRVTVDAAARRRANGSLVDDGDEARFLARQEPLGVHAEERTERKVSRAARRAAAAAGADEDRATVGEVEAQPKAHRAEKNGATRRGGKQQLIDEDDEGGDSIASDDDTYVARLANRLMRAADANGNNQEGGDEGESTSSDSSSDDDEPDVTLIGDITIPARVWVNLLDYQQVGVRWLVERHLRLSGGILGDEMGLGKTIQTAALLSALHNSNKLVAPVLILAPLTVLQQWLGELRKWVPALRVVVLHSSGTATKSRADLLREVARRPVVILTTYTTASIEVEAIGRAGPQYVILDEGHKISNPDSDTTIAVKTFPTPHRLILSGSPIQNTLKELWCLFDFVAPGMLGSMHTFISEFEEPIKASRHPSATPMQVQTAIECARALRDHIAPFMLRRLKRDVNTMLPPKHEKVVRCKLTDRQLQEYLNVLASAAVQDFKRRVTRIKDEVGDMDRNGRMRNTGGLQSHMAYGRHGMSDGLTRQAFRSLTELRAISNHVDLHTVKSEHRAEGGDTGYVSFRSNNEVDLQGSGKLQALDVLLQRWHEEGHRVLVFSQTRTALDIIENLVEQRAYTYFRMDGTTPSHHRQHLIDRFNRDESVFGALLTTRVGGLGVNLVGADRVVIFDPDWNPVTDEQARERAWRIGQTREVIIYRMVTSGTVEEHILHRQLAKLYVAEKVLSDPTLQRSFHLATMSEAFLLGPEYADRVGPNSRGLVALTGVNVREEVRRGQVTFDTHGNTLTADEKAAEEAASGNVVPPQPTTGDTIAVPIEHHRPKTIHFSGDAVSSTRVRVAGTTSRLAALEGDHVTDSSLGRHLTKDEEALPGDVKIESIARSGGLVKREASSQMMPSGVSQTQGSSQIDPNAQTSMLQQMVYAGVDLDDAEASNTLASRLAQVVAQRTLHRATTNTSHMMRRPSAAGGAQSQAPAARTRSMQARPHGSKDAPPQSHRG
jgi:DNA excision repair protein ERCC-6